MRGLRAACLVSLGLALCSPASSLAAAKAVDPAVTLVQQGAEAYKAGRYVAAAELFVSAFELSKAPIQLRNAAKAYTKGEQWSQAEATWQRYAALSDLSPAERAEAKAELSALKQRKVAQQAQAEAKTAQAQARAARQEALRAEAAQAQAERLAAVSTQPAQEPSSPVLAYALVGTGAAAVLTSAVLFFHANARLNDLDADLAMTNDAGQIDGIRRDDAQSELSGVEAERTASAVLLAVGAASAIGGAALWMLAADEAPPVAASLTPLNGGGYAGLLLSF